MGAYTEAQGENSFTNGLCTVALGKNQSVLGQYNIKKGDDILLAVGNGTSDSNRSNAFEVHSDGRVSVGADPKEDMDVVNLKTLMDIVGNINEILITVTDGSAREVLTTVVDGEIEE